MLPRVLLLLTACWAAVDGRHFEDMPNTTLVGKTTLMEATSQCQCKMKCFVQMNCRGATYTSEEKCHLLLGGLSGQGRLVPEQGSHSWYRSGFKLAMEFFLTRKRTRNGTLASQQFICLAEEGSPASILTQDDFDAVNADIVPQLQPFFFLSGHYAWVALVQTGTDEYGWHDGTSIWDTGLFSESKVGIFFFSGRQNTNGRLTASGGISLMSTPSLQFHRVMCQRLTF